MNWVTWRGRIKLSTLPVPSRTRFINFGETVTAFVLYGRGAGRRTVTWQTLSSLIYTYDIYRI